MRELTIKESVIVAGGNQPAFEEHSYSREFWDSVAHGSGIAVGVFWSPLVLVGMLAYGVVYATASAAVSVTTGLYMVGSYIADSVYSGGAAAYNTISGPAK